MGLVPTKHLTLRQDDLAEWFRNYHKETMYIIYIYIYKSIQIMNPNDPTGLNKVLMQMQPLMLSRTPDFQKFSSPSELGVPVAVGDASRLPSQCLPESSNTKLSKSQQHPKALSFSFTSTHRLPKMSCSIYSPFASMCQHFSGEREKGSLVRRGVFIGYLLSHLSLLSTRRHPNEFQ